ncbi:MAG TPA: potassium transporter Kup [Vitreimonas sp.]|uniref:potassium transporter Kup n=1 Tax=Vitreimonas sp. TaxID=3069702 RepID=UPI002D5D331E|nr:potassium transporter Kup [Vitreimonas sp.]HYD89724.1 potassium transporter Kup [Vitreimonas sp.]
MAQAPAEAPQPNTSGSGADGGGRGRALGHGGFWTLLLGSIGVVYGDIGTSPLYALRECLRIVTDDFARAPERNEVIGIVSLIFWALIIVVTIKSVFLLLRFDNKGEGGTLSLMALVRRAFDRRTAVLLGLGMLGAALFYADAMITPAVSVLSSVEGLKAVPGIGRYLDPWILPIGIVILIALFVAQSRGTARIGALFGPITLAWFLTMAALGLVHIFDDPGIVMALSPLPALAFFVSHAGLSFVVLGAVFLAVTGAEALYADMGHFGRRPISRAWVFIILPCLTLNYLGQGALALSDPTTLENLFFMLPPDWAKLPVVLLATFATVIASQAVITGAFSITQQAIQLGILPRMEIRRTSETQAGQIFMPQVNWLMLAGVLILLLAFGSSERLAAAYGIAVSGEMVVSTVLVFLAIWKLWKRPAWLAALICIPFLLIEATFFSSNMLKVWSGGFVPLMLAAGLVIVMWTWVRGTRLLTETVRRDEPLAKLFETLSHHPPHRVRGAAIFLTGDPDVAPAALMHNLKHNQVLHEQIIILTVKTINAPRAPEGERVKVEDFLPDVKRVTLTFGFMETPNVVKALTEARKHGLKFDIMKTSFFLSRRTIVPSEKSGMPLWQDHLFIFLARNATNATDFFHIPSGRAVELGNQVMV